MNQLKSRTLNHNRGSGNKIIINNYDRRETVYTHDNQVSSEYAHRKTLPVQGNYQIPVKRVIKLSSSAKKKDGLQSSFDIQTRPTQNSIKELARIKLMDMRKNS